MMRSVVLFFLLSHRTVSWKYFSIGWLGGVVGSLVMMTEYGVAQAKGVNQRVGFHGSQVLLVENY